MVITIALCVIATEGCVRVVMAYDAGEQENQTMTDATPPAMKNELEKLELEAAEKRDSLMEYVKIELRKIKEEHGRDVLLQSLVDFPTLNRQRSFVEDLPNTAKDDALAALKAGMSAGPRAVA
jgi:hypothetical protein